MAAASSEFSYIIVGSGVFGASTAYHLPNLTQKPKLPFLIDLRPFPAHLQLLMTITRSYEQIMKTGMVVVGSPEESRQIINNYVDLETYTEACIISTEELKQRYGKLYGNTDYNGVTEAFVNPLSGWAEATNALQAVIEAAISNGVEYIKADIESLLIGEGDNCHGVRTKDGRSITANKVVLSTGAGTAKLLADSAPTRLDIQAGDRITAAAVITGVILLPQEKMQQYANHPVFVHAGDTTGQVLPPNSDGLLKFCVDGSFKNTTLHKSSGQMISAPPDEAGQGQTTVCQALKDECARVVKGIYGNDLDGLQFDSFRICWDGITPSQDFIISGHPTCKNLYIVTGGSFHGWKFLPIIGKYAVKLLDGTLDEDLLQRWGWDRDQLGSAHTRAIPKRELREI